MTPPPRALPAIHRVLPRVYYGWAVAIGSGLLSFAVIGIGFYGQSIFLSGLIDERGWDREAVSGAASVYFVLGGLAMPLVGVLVDRFGPRLSIVLGAFTMAAGLLWVGRAPSPLDLFAAYGLLAIGFALAGSIPNNAIITRWFVARRAWAMSISQTGVSLGGILLVPLASGLIRSRGMEVTTLTLAILLLGIVVPVAIWVLRSGPEPHGLRADGRRSPPAEAAPAEKREAERVWRSRDAARSTTFWTLAIAFSGMLFCQMGFLIHALAFLNERLDAPAADIAYALIPAASIVGRLAVGSFADRVTKHRLCAALFLTQAAMLGTLSLLPGAFALYAATLALGLTIGNVFMMQSLLVGDLFGIRSFGAVFGLLQLITQIAGGLGPVAVGFLYTGLGGYEPTWGLLAVIAAASGAVLLRIQPPNAPGVRQAGSPPDGV